MTGLPSPRNEHSPQVKRGASQYYLLHFGMPGSGARAPVKAERRNYPRFFSSK